MRNALNRGTVAAGLLAALFAVSAAISFAVLPRPHTRFHALLAGGFATSVTMLGLLAPLSVRRSRRILSARRDRTR